MQKIAKDTIVTLKYELRDPDGNLLDAGEQPIEYLHGGYESIFLPIEDALEGKGVGDNVTVKLQPADAFGEYDSELLHVEPLENLPEGLEVGMMIEGEIAEEHEGDSVFYTVTEIAADRAVLDANHPFPGQSLVFKGTVEAVRPATSEEIAELLAD